ncbi:MAG: PilZ domain-containing protein [Myxococcales bacterium]|nr:PilZ domain-containing protein [Myxococcales bacterium]MCB9606440.1 PilZ domain-containing protein [Polyangiaceae bacterium]
MERTVDDKRKHPRSPCNLYVSCTLASSDTPVEGTAKDIGPGGMFIECAAMPKFGEAVEISLTLPGVGTESRLPAVVRWATGSGFGVQFGFLGARDTHAITELMKQSH